MALDAEVKLHWKKRQFLWLFPIDQETRHKIKSATAKSVMATISISMRLRSLGTGADLYIIKTIFFFF